MRRNFRYQDFTGGLNNVSSVGTINQSPKRTESPDMVNVEYYKLGGIKTMEGNTQIGDTQADSIIGGWEYIKGNYRYMLIGTENGDVKEYDPITDTFNLIFTFDTPSQRMSFCNMNNGVVITNGVDDLMFYDKFRDTLLNGNVSVTDGSTTITGSSTTFGTDVVLGDYITIEQCAGKYKVVEITDDTSMKVEPAIDTTSTIHYYNFFNGADNYYCLKAEPEVGDDVYDDNEQVISTVDYYQALEDGEGSIVFQIDSIDVLGVRRHVPSGSDTFNRDKDVTIEPSSLSNLTFRLTDLSQCHATLTSAEDPGLNTDIRGLAINFFGGRLFVGSGNGIYYSELGKYNGWQIDGDGGAGVIQSIYNDTSDVKALGLYASYLVIHKEFASYLLSGSSTPSEWQISPFASISCDSQQSYVQTNTRYYVYSKENMGIYPLLQHTAFTDKNLGQDISRNIRNIFLQVNQDLTDKIFAVRYPKKRYMMFYMPNSYGLGSSLAVVFDFQTKTWLRRQVPQEVTIVFEFDNNVYLGTKDGKILKEFTGTTFDGEPIKSRWKSPWFEFGDGSLWKSIEEFCITMPEDETSNFSINVYRDGESKKVSRQISSEIKDINALIWEGDIDNPDNRTYWDNNNWAKQQFGQLRFPTAQSFFRMYQVEFETKDINQAFHVVGFGFNRVEAEEAPW